MASRYGDGEGTMSSPIVIDNSDDEPRRGKVLAAAASSSASASATASASASASTSTSVPEPPATAATHPSNAAGAYLPTILNPAPTLLPPSASQTPQASSAPLAAPPVPAPRSTRQTRGPTDSPLPPLPESWTDRRRPSVPGAAQGSGIGSGGGPANVSRPATRRSSAAQPAATVPAAPIPALAAQPPSQPPTQREFVLPRWQPDAEVTYCPICHTQFSIFVRKHHCRKCGRVVCNSCSPHRITIPYPYIVRPPGSVPYPGETAANAARGTAEDVGGLGGGERVRLCNPCVPDPNTAPPASSSGPLSGSSPYYWGQVRQAGGGSSGNPNAISEWNTATAFHPAIHGAGQRLPFLGDFTSALYLPVQRPPHFPHSFLTGFSHPALSAAPGSAGASDRRFSGSSQGTYHISAGRPRPSFGADGSTGSNPPTDAGVSEGGASGSASRADIAAARARGQYQHAFGQRHHRLSLPHAATMASSSTAPGVLMHSNQASQAPQAPPSQPEPRYLIAEEDECPVCRRELPKRDLIDFETLRESHISECIISHSLYMGGSPARRATGASPVPSSSSAGGGATTTASGSSPMPSPSPMPPPQRLTGMFPYRATEKDCVDAAECTICLEELEVGVPMARLECFCRFHEKCIRAWFVKRPGRCPVHQHDNFGY